MAEDGRAKGGLQGVAGRMSVFAVIAVLVTLNLYQYLILFHEAYAVYLALWQNPLLKAFPAIQL